MNLSDAHLTLFLQGANFLRSKRIRRLHHLAGRIESRSQRLTESLINSDLLSPYPDWVPSKVAFCQAAGDHWNLDPSFYCGSNIA